MLYIELNDGFLLRFWRKQINKRTLPRMSIVMSEIELKRTNLLNNDSAAGNKRFDRLSSGARRVATGGDVRGTDRDRAAEALRDREVKRTRAGSGAINLTSRFSAGGLGREGDDPGQSF
jgi:hypothetical protein